MTAPLLNQAPNSPPLGNPVPLNLLQMFAPSWLMTGNNRWREEPGGTFQFKPGDSSATMNISCPYSDIIQPSADLIGYPLYPNANGMSTANRGISRVLPATHPIWWWLFCTAVINGKGQKTLGWTYGSTNVLTTFLYSTGSLFAGPQTIPISDFTPSYGGTATTMGIVVGTVLQFVSVNTPSNNENAVVSAVDDTGFTVNLANSYTGGYIVTGLQTPYMNYDRAQFTLTFQSLPYQVLPDMLVNGTLITLPFPGPPAYVLNTTVGEWQRFCEWEFMPNLEILQRRAGTFTFTPNQGSISNKPFPQSIFKRSPKSTLICHWRQVPHQLIWGVDAGLLGDFNPNWQACLGKVNSDFWPAPGNFECYNPSEMLLTAIKLIPKEAPVSPVTLGLGYLGVPRIWDVDFYWSVFSPPRNSLYLPNLMNTPLQAGHNLFPSPTNDGYFYFATGGAAAPPAGTLAGNALYQAYDYSELFKGYE